MDTELTRPGASTRLKRELSRDAINLAISGEWERAAEMNRAILELYSDDVEAMNRLARALMELVQYGDARTVSERVTKVAPYNTIGKKNAARLAKLESAAAPIKRIRNTGGAPQLFIEESGKSGTTILRKPASSEVTAHLSPGDPAKLGVENDVLLVYTQADEYLGQIEPKMGKRLIRLIQGGNQYDCAIIGINDRGISVILRETHRSRSLHNVCSFPSRGKEEHRVFLNESVARFIRDDELDEDDEEENVIDEEEMETDWNEGE